MAKFSEQSEQEQIFILREEFMLTLEKLLQDPTEILNKYPKELPEEKYKIVKEFLPSLKPADCDCGLCIDTDKLERRTPKELIPIIEIARKECEANENY